MREREGYVVERRKVVEKTEYDGCWNRGCCGYGCVTALAVLIALVLAATAVGGGGAARFDGDRFILGVGLGSKDLVRGTMPSYIQGLIGRNDNFSNNTFSFNFGDLEADIIWALGRSIRAPDADLTVNINRKQ